MCQLQSAIFSVYSALSYSKPVFLSFSLGLEEEYLSSQGPDCCDVRWSGCDSAVGAACALTRLPGSFSLHRKLSSGAVSCTNRLHGSKLKLCVLVLFLLHTVISITTLQHCSTGSLEAIVPLEEVPMREE